MSDEFEAETRDESSGRPHRAAEAFFGRRKAKPLTVLQQALWESLLPRLALDLDAAAPADPAELFAHRPRTIRLEIGFGGGEHLAHEAERFPDAGFIGAEPFINGLAKALTLVHKRGLSNVRLSGEDATRLLDWLPAASLDRVDLLYPDPWHKRRHWKRRFVSDRNLDRIVRALKPGGEFRFASDIASYVDWTLAHVQPRGDLAWTTPGERHAPWEGWTRTRYEAKAIREGRPPAYLVFRKPGETG